MMQKRAQIFSFTLFSIFFISLVSAGNGCHDTDNNCAFGLTDGCDIRGDLTLTQGDYDIGYGVDLCQNNIIFDCNNATLRDTRVLSNEFISIKNLNDTTVKNCILSLGGNRVREAIVLTNAHKNKILSNTIFAEQERIIVGNSNYNLIENNVISVGGTFRKGSIQIGGSNNIAKLNTITNTGDAAISVGGDYNTINLNTIQKSAKGVNIGGSWNLIENNYIAESNEAISLGHSFYNPNANNLITSNTLFNNSNGIAISGDTSGQQPPANNVFAYNLITGRGKTSGAGIYIAPYGSGPTINNSFIENEINFFGTGIYTSKSFNNIIKSNEIYNNLNGVYLQNSANLLLTSNIITSNDYYGIRKEGNNNDETIISQNKIANNNDSGIYFYYVANQTVKDNIITGNKRYGINIEGISYDNLIYNNIFNNSINARDVSSRANNWNVTKDCSRRNILGVGCIGGNFWHDYTGQDNNGDGIGDTNLPYKSNGNINLGGDYLPLKKSRFPKMRSQEALNPINITRL